MSQLHHIRKYESWIQMLLQNIIHRCHQQCQHRNFLLWSLKVCGWISERRRGELNFHIVQFWLWNWAITALQCTVGSAQARANEAKFHISLLGFHSSSKRCAYSTHTKRCQGIGKTSSGTHWKSVAASALPALWSTLLKFFYRLHRVLQPIRTAGRFVLSPER